MARVTIADVAREAGVSVMTVSRVINHKGEISESTRNRVQQAIDRLQYRPSAIARSLSTQRTKTIGLVVPDISNPFFPEIVRGAENTAWKEGYMVVLSSAEEDLCRETKILQKLEDNRVDGVIICSARLPDKDLLPLIEAQDAVVVINRNVPAHLAGMVEVDDAYGTMRGIHHLRTTNRHVIGFLAGPSNSYSSKKRLQGYRNAIESTGETVEPELIEPCPPDEAGGYQALKILLARYPAVNGLICYNDLVAIGALQACTELGISVPEELAIIGCDDIRLASLVTPALTTLRAPIYDLGELAMNMLLDKLAGRECKQMVTVRPELVVRVSAP